MKRPWCYLIRNVYRRSLSSGLNRENLSFLKSRPARTPPSTFLFLHLYLSNSLEPGGPYPLGASRTPLRRQMTTDNHRLFIHSSKSGASRGTRACLGRGPKPRRAQWPSYRPAPTALSTGVINKSSHIRNEASATRKVPFFRDLALRPQSCDVLRVLWKLNRRMPLGAGDFHQVGEGDRQRSLFRTSRNIERPGPALSVRELGQPQSS